MNYKEKLLEYADKEYAIFQSKLTPNVAPDSFIGVRVPNVRTLAKEIYKEGNFNDFLNSLPHNYYDENMLHGLIISEIKDFDECISEVDKFLPFIDNWAVCDIMSPKIFKKNKDKLLENIKRWSMSKHTYTCRFGIEMLMSHFLDDDFKKEYLEIPLKVKSDEYYVNMMLAWFYATALTKKWDYTIKIIEDNKLDKWVHNKTIQKACESYRISEKEKEFLKKYKRI